MAGYRFTPEAAADLVEIWTYIASDNAEAADRVEAAIYDACSLVAQAPLSGQLRKDLTDRPVRFWTVQTVSKLRDGDAGDFRPGPA